MDLKSYLDKTQTDDTKLAHYRRFAESLGVSVHTVYKWLNGTRRIKDRDKLRITELTEGKVRIADMVKS